MTFRLSQRSLDRLAGVNPKLVNVVKRAIEITMVDFGVSEGVRSIETQRKYFEAKKTQTMNSKHLTGDAVDLVAYVDGQVSWELNLYDEIADAMQQAAIELGVAIRWGGAWIVDDIRAWSDTMEDAMNHYIDVRRQEGKRPFIDAPHFEMA